MCGQTYELLKMLRVMYMHTNLTSRIIDSSMSSGGWSHDPGDNNAAYKPGSMSHDLHQRSHPQGGHGRHAPQQTCDRGDHRAQVCVCVHMCVHSLCICLCLSTFLFSLME